jgi:hypothetical protein
MEKCFSAISVPFGEESVTNDESHCFLMSSPATLVGFRAVVLKCPVILPGQFVSFFPEC